MSFTVNTKIQPLIEDVGRIIPGVFLKSTEYKRWLVEHELDEVWSQIFNHIKSNRSFFAMGYDHDAADSKDALGYLSSEHHLRAASRPFARLLVGTVVVLFSGTVRIR